jgi:molecular chaperone GrpE
MTAKNKHTQPAAPTPEHGSAPAGPETTLSPQELENLKAAAAKADENWDKFLRAAADLENYRKRVGREKEELARFTSERVVSALLPVLDNLERALDAAEKNVGTPTQVSGRPDALLDGLRQVQAQFRRTLVEFGLQEVIANAGHPFDPNLQEAVGQVESAEHPEGHIVEQLQRGYKLADRLLRPARVVVSKGAAQPESVDLDVPPPDSE